MLVTIKSKQSISHPLKDYTSHCPQRKRTTFLSRQYFSIRVSHDSCVAALTTGRDLFLSLPFSASAALFKCSGDLIARHTESFSIALFGVFLLSLRVYLCNVTHVLIEEAKKNTTVQAHSNNCKCGLPMKIESPREQEDGKKKGRNRRSERER